MRRSVKPPLPQRLTQLRLTGWREKEQKEEKTDQEEQDGHRARTNSSPSEMRARRLRSSVRREQYYGSVELVVSVDPRGMIRNIGRFRLEPSSDIQRDFDMEAPVPSSSVIVENPQEETRWYWKYFLGNEHQNFAGIDPSTKTPFFLSILVEDEIDDNKLCRAILWTSKGPRRLCVPTPMTGKPLTAKAILQRFPGMTDYNRGLKEITNAKIQKDLIILEDQEGSVNCKFGVIYALADQVSDAQMLSNEHGSEHFERFLKILGQRIELQQWGSYRGGLDVTTNSTGKESVYTVFAGHEIMFHVSTLLPYSKENMQQIERKRHVGNDIVNIVFEEGTDPLHPNFSPTMMKSHFTHVFAVVTFEEKTGLWRLWVFSEESVPAFGPSLPLPNTFSDPAQFREFLVTKLINAEKAAFQARVFVEKRHRTNDTLLKDMYIEYLKDFNKSFNKVTDTVIKHLRSPIRKEPPADTAEFCKLGELIKLEKMLSGDVTDSLNMSICRKQPWEKEQLLRNIPAVEVLSADGWGGAALLVATEEHGVVFISAEDSDGTKRRVVIEPAARIQQLAVLEHFGLMVARTERGKDSCLVVFALSDLRASLRTGQTIVKKIAQQKKIPGTKGCHLFARSPEGGLRLSIAACVGRKVLLLRWALGPLGRLAVNTDLPNNFTLLRSHSLPDDPSALCLYERSAQNGVVKAVAVCGKHVYVVNMSEGSEEEVACEVRAASIVRSAGDGDSDEFVILHQNNTILYENHEGRWHSEQTFWSTTLNSFVFHFPFIIGFGEDLVEIRLAVNGNLLASMYMPSVRLLSFKSDIVFCVERAFSSTAIASRSSLVRKPHAHTEKRWDVYRFKGTELSMIGKTREQDQQGTRTPNLTRKDMLGECIQDICPFR